MLVAHVDMPATPATVDIHRPTLEKRFCRRLTHTRKPAHDRKRGNPHALCGGKGPSAIARSMSRDHFSGSALSSDSHLSGSHLEMNPLKKICAGRISPVSLRSGQGFGMFSDITVITASCSMASWHPVNATDDVVRAAVAGHVHIQGSSEGESPVTSSRVTAAELSAVTFLGTSSAQPQPGVRNMSSLAVSTATGLCKCPCGVCGW